MFVGKGFTFEVKYRTCTSLDQCLRFWFFQNNLNSKPTTKICFNKKDEDHMCDEDMHVHLYSVIDSSAVCLQEVLRKWRVHPKALALRQGRGTVKMHKTQPHRQFVLGSQEAWPSRHHLQQRDKRSTFKPGDRCD